MACALAGALHLADRKWIRSFPRLHAGERASPPREMGVTAVMSLRIVGVMWRLGVPRQTCVSGSPILEGGGGGEKASLVCPEIG